MTVGRTQYSEGDMLRMQKDAEARVKDMQSRARRTVEEANNESFPSSSRNRNWSSNPNMNRQRGRSQQNSSGRQQQGRKPEPPPPPPVQEAAPPEPETKKTGTIVSDIMNALNLDEDYLLIIGLMLILINQRADTTLILALAYLLI